MWTTDGPSFVMDEQNRFAVRRLALDQHTLWALTPTQKIATIILYPKLEALYAVEGESLTSSFKAPRTQCCQLTLTDIPKGPTSGSQSAPWTSGRAKETLDKYNAVTKYMAAENYGWKPPKLLCRKIVREDLDIEAQVRLV